MSTSCESDVRRQASVKASLMCTSDSREEQAGEGIPAAIEEKKHLASGMLQPFKVRNFNLLFGGQMISVIGDPLAIRRAPVGSGDPVWNDPKSVEGAIEPTFRSLLRAFSE